MADEKIVVVCAGTCNGCKFMWEDDFRIGCASWLNANKGDVVTIEIKRNKDLTK